MEVLRYNVLGDGETELFHKDKEAVGEQTSGWEDRQPLYRKAKVGPEAFPNIYFVNRES